MREYWHKADHGARRNSLMRNRSRVGLLEVGLLEVTFTCNQPQKGTQIRAVARDLPMTIAASVPLDMPD